MKAPPREYQRAIDAASEHEYRCRCALCLQWWVVMGPDGGDPDDFGPFTADEIKAAAREMGEPFNNGRVP